MDATPTALLACEGVAPPERDTAGPSDATDDGRLDDSTDDVTNAARLAEYWGAQFRATPIDERLAGALVRRILPQLRPTTAAPFPTPATFAEAARRARPTAPGPDGLGYGGWRYAGRLAWNVLSRLAGRMAATSRV